MLTYATRELFLVITNTRETYFGWIIPYCESLAKKAVSGKFSKEKAIKGYENLVKSEITRYNKRYGKLPAISAADKKNLCKELYDYYEDMLNEMIKNAKKTKKQKK